MDLNKSSFMCYSISAASPPHPKEFEFQMSSNSLDTEANTISPADELFYKGNLLPLHLPPRLQMVAKLLHNSQQLAGDVSEETMTKADYSGSDGNNSWSKKIKSMKQSPLGLKLKASRDYLKSIFSTAKLAGCSDEPQSMANEFAGGKAAAVRRYLQLEDTCIAEVLLRPHQLDLFDGGEGLIVVVKYVFFVFVFCFILLLLCEIKWRRRRRQPTAGNYAEEEQQCEF